MGDVVLCLVLVEGYVVDFDVVVVWWVEVEGLCVVGFWGVWCVWWIVVFVDGWV